MATEKPLSSAAADALPHSGSIAAAALCVGAEALACSDRAQIDRILDEVSALAERAGVLLPDPPQPATEHGQTIRQMIAWMFSFRATLIGFPVARHWTESFSRLGPPEGADVLLASEYQRSELTIPETSPLARYYPWLERPRHDWVIRYTANGMSAVAVFLLGLVRAARQAGRPITLYTTPLYHETRQFLQSWICEHSIDWQPRATEDALLAAAGRTEERYALLLDSSEALDTIEILRCLPSVRAKRPPVAVGWDNTCIPFDTPLPATNLAAPVYLLRSHIKLDQLGFELGALGSVCAVQEGKISPEATVFLHEFLPRLPLLGQLLGVNASADLLRRMHRVGLPDPQLTPRSNRALMRANRVGAQVLRELLWKAPGVEVLTYPHAVFTAVRLRHPLEQKPGAALKGATDAARHLHERAADLRLPLLNSASFGFAFTAAIGFAEIGEFGERPVLRIAFGGHDDELTLAIAKLISEGVRCLSR